MTSLPKIRAGAVMLCLVLLVAPGSLLAPSQASASGLTCAAQATPTHPAQYSTVTVAIRARPGARITTVAHYRTTSHPKAGVADSAGYGVVDYWISGATIGYRVIVTVTVRIGTLSGTCRTFFTPV